MFHGFQCYYHFSSIMNKNSGKPFYYKHLAMLFKGY